MAAPHAVTRLLIEWRNGDQAALQQLMPLLYGELRDLADSYVRREGPGATLQPTALVHEAIFGSCRSTFPIGRAGRTFSV